MKLGTVYQQSPIDFTWYNRGDGEITVELQSGTTLQLGPYTLTRFEALALATLLKMGAGRLATEGK